jgi:F0F1-type ATP synthase assembly protein I
MKAGPPAKNNREGLFHGLQFGLTILGGLAAGYWVDKEFGCSPAGALLGFFGGAAAGFYSLIRAMK